MDKDIEKLFEAIKQYTTETDAPLLLITGKGKDGVVAMNCSERLEEILTETLLAKEFKQIAKAFVKAIAISCFRNEEFNTLIALLAKTAAEKRLKENINLN